MPYEFTHQYPREAADFYVEPEFCVEALFKAVQFIGSIHDPACGIGTIPEVARAFRYQVTGRDLVDRGYGKVGDFLTDTNSYPNIVTNPPYNLVEPFFHKAYELAAHKIALLTRLAFLEGQKRYHTIYQPYPPSQVLVFSTRPSMPPYGKPVGGGKTAYCWIVWDKDQWQGLTKMRWLLRNQA